MNRWLDKLRSIKTAGRAQIISAAVSAVFLGMATWITTLQVPRIEDKIDKEDAVIKELRYEMTKDLVQGLYAMDVHTDRRIDFLDVRLERIMVSSRSKREQLLLETAIGKTLDQIKQWNSLFKGEEEQGVTTMLPIFDSNTPAEQKIIKLEPVLVRARRDAYSRLEKVIEQVRTHELQKSEHESERKTMETRFRLFQMIGLFMLMLAVTLEARKKLKEAVPDNKESDIREHVAQPDRGKNPASG